MDLRKKITKIVIDNVMIDIDNTGQEQYKMNEEQFGLLIDNLVKKLNIDDVSKSFYCQTERGCTKQCDECALIELNPPF